MWRIVTFLYWHASNHFMSRPTKPPEKQRLRLAPAVALARWEPSRAFPGKVGVCCCPATRVMSAVDVMLHPLAPTRMREAAGGHPGSGHRSLSVLRGVSHGGTSLTAGHPSRREPRLPRPHRRAPGRAGPVRRLLAGRWLRRRAGAADAPVAQARGCVGAKLRKGRPGRGSALPPHPPPPSLPAPPALSPA